MALDPSTVAIIIALLSSIPGIVTIFRQLNLDKKQDERNSIEYKKLYEEIEKINREKRVIEEEAEKIRAESEETTVNTALSLVAPLKQRINELELELKKVIFELRSIEELLVAKENRIKELEENEKKFMQEIIKLKEIIKELEVELDKFKKSN